MHGKMRAHERVRDCRESAIAGSLRGHLHIFELLPTLLCVCCLLYYYYFVFALFSVVVCTFLRLQLRFPSIWWVRVRKRDVCIRHRICHFRVPAPAGARARRCTDYYEAKSMCMCVWVQAQLTFWSTYIHVHVYMYLCVYRNRFCNCVRQ